jgi:elongation factor 1 alpha-like protein
LCLVAALALSFSVAKPLLADLQPPIPDDSIRESLWHYFFDVDKAVNYLRKERQKG